MPSGIKIDTREFDAALREYLKVSERDLAYIVNKRAINIAFLALRKTPSARLKRIELDLRRRMPSQGRKGKGRPPRAALLIASGSSKAGLKGKPTPGLYGAKMREAIDDLIKRRQRTRAYIKSGWIRAVRDIEAKTPGRAKRKPRNSQDFSKLPGQGIAARRGIRPSALIINHATGAGKISGGALQAAMNADAADMRKFAQRRMSKTAAKFSAR